MSMTISKISTVYLTPPFEISQDKLSSLLGRTITMKQDQLPDDVEFKKCVENQTGLNKQLQFLRQNSTSIRKFLHTTDKGNADLHNSAVTFTKKVFEGI